MHALRLSLLGVFLLVSPAWAESWRVEDVDGDAVSAAARMEAEPIGKGEILRDGWMVVSGSAARVKLTRGGDVVDVAADSVVDFRHEGGVRAVVEPKAGRVEIKAETGADGPLRATTRFFTADAQAASFSLVVRRDYATLDVVSGEVKLRDLVHGGRLVTLHAGGGFRGAPAAPAKGTAAKSREEEAAKAATAEIDKAFDNLQKFSGKSGEKLSREEKAKRNATVKALAAKGLAATRQGMEDLAEDYEGDPPVEIPRIGILDFLFGPKAPGAGYVLAGLGAIFLAFGALTAKGLGSAGFGALGNAVILLMGALLGAALHDYAFPPELFWAFEPTPGIATTTILAAAALAGACVLRVYIADRWVEAGARKLTKAVAQAPRQTFG